MRRVVLFIAMSLDGYIADETGGVEWLTGQGEDAESADSYGTFEKSVDTVIMGWRTYHQVTAELSPERWVYEGLKTYVLTHRPCRSADNITFLTADPCRLVEALRSGVGKDIWICGGASLVEQLMAEDLIDLYRISVIPALLGRGLRLFPEGGQKHRLCLIGVKSSNGIVELSYRKRELPLQGPVQASMPGRNE